ncbi:MAG TPA: response regulator [Deltaproteobacteria bacterium]|nr:MAG: response regulator [Deltaproteobacteria bacterium]RLB06553.1 MAG: response regulator [Deltaproteobacteria bacterium]HDM75579.1 response regulator [Deltaproteobacteria bacterium]
MSKAVLIVDDSEMVRNFHAYILKSAGFNVISAVDGADGLEKLYMNDIGLVLTDINMPNMDGYTLIEKIRSDEEFEDLPIIIISTEDEARDKQRGYDAGANLYIVKPTDPANLIENVRLLLEE